MIKRCKKTWYIILVRIALFLVLKKKVLQELYHEFLLKLHNDRISLAKLNKLVDKLWELVKIMIIEIWQHWNNHKHDKKLLPQQ